MAPSTASSETRSGRNACEMLVVRHGLTDYNQIHRLQGQLDIPLNETGREQCQACGRRLREEYASPDQTGVHVDAVYSSPLSRAVESAEIICREAGIPSSAIKRDSRIMEWNAGILQGSLLSDISTLFPHEWEMWRRNRDPDFVFPGGESLRMRFQRVRSFFSEIAKKHQGQRVLVVTHGGVLDDLFRIVRQIPLHCATNAPKLNAELHLLEASVKDEPDDVEVAGLETSATDDGIQKCVPPGPDGDCGVHWSILRWGKLGPNVESKTLRTTDPPNTIEYV